jgi:hypothetical protein
LPAKLFPVRKLRTSSRTTAPFDRTKSIDKVRWKSREKTVWKDFLTFESWDRQTLLFGKKLHFGIAVSTAEHINPVAYPHLDSVYATDALHIAPHIWI